VIITEPSASAWTERDIVMVLAGWCANRLDAGNLGGGFAIEYSFEQPRDCATKSRRRARGC
jgi:hypothetical protein